MAKYISYEEGCSRGYLILKLRKVIKDIKTEAEKTNDEFFKGRESVAKELEELLFILPPEL